MWDPRTYEDTDYGLDEGESFEPDVLPDDEPFDLSQPHIMTVLGPIETDELGVCLPATRFFPDSLAAPSDREHARSLAAAAEELEAFASVGGRSVVDVATQNSGRDVAALMRLTQLVPSHLIASTGVDSTANDPIGQLDAVIRDGIEGTGIHAGLIAVRPHDLESANLVERITDMAGRHGMPLLAELDSWKDAVPFLTSCRNRTGGNSHSPGIPILLTGPKSLPESGLVSNMVALGAYVVVSAAGAGFAREDEQLAQHIVHLASEGYEERLLVTLDLVAPRRPRVDFAAPMSPYLVDWLPLALMNAGATALDVRRLLIENPARALTISPAENHG